VLTAPLFPTPAFTMIDHNLVRELKLRMTDLQCIKFAYGGQKLRILGKVSTSVQCVIDGVPAGNFHLKAHVVQDIYQLFDTHSIAGVKMSEQLVGLPFAGKPVELYPEPTVNTTKKRKKSKAKLFEESPSRDSRSESPRSASGSVSSTPPPCSTPPCSTPPRPTPPRPKVQGRWIKKQWVPNPYNKPDEFACYYLDRVTGEEEYEKPGSWDSDGSLHSPSSARSYHASADEYEDIYANESVVIKVPPDKDSTANRQYSLADQKLVHKIWKKTQDVPRYLQRSYPTWR
jgi:hypothetical protein